MSEANNHDGDGANGRTPPPEQNRTIPDAVEALLEMVARSEEGRQGETAARALLDRLADGGTYLEFAIRVEATSCSFVGIERNYGGQALGVLDVLLHAKPGAGDFLGIKHRA